MSAYFEIGLHLADNGEYIAELRFRMGAVDLVYRGQPKFDMAKLDVAPMLDEDILPPDPPGAADDQPVSYGKLLYNQLFAEANLRTAFNNSWVTASAADQPLRVRLFIGPTAQKLHRLHWELLHDPKEKDPLWKGNLVHFCRYLSSSDWRPVHRRAREALRALIVVANPADLKQYNMTSISPAEEVARAGEDLGEIPADAVFGPDTLVQMRNKLRGEYDIIYLVCHGGLGPTDDLRLWLEDANGQTERTAGGVLVTLLADLWHRPQLVVLAACYGAGAGEDTQSVNDGSILTAVGPKLAEAGLPAVLAMQGQVSMRTARSFMSEFFRELSRHGHVDRAATAARGAVKNRRDHWMPVLFSRISDGRIWSGSGVDEEFGGWKGLRDAITTHECVPILGWGLLESLVGGSREIARRWANDTDFAMAPHHREDLPQVAQYLAVMEGPLYPRRNLTERLRDELARRAAPGPHGQKSVDELLEMARARRREAGRFDPFDVLARLPFRLYVTTTPDDQMERALRAVGRPADVAVCRWHDRDEVEWPVSQPLDKDLFYTPKSNNPPLVYQLFGRLGMPKSLVLTEDDYFDFLIEVNREPDRRLPPGIRTTLGKSALLFLGFRMEEWDFRVLFRHILGQGGKWRLSKDYRHVAVQIDPDDGRILDPHRARRYLSDYFQKADIFMYWGSVEDFLRGLQRRCQAMMIPAAAGAAR
jgi:CHAT domain/SIR2-like domain